MILVLSNLAKSHYPHHPSYPVKLKYSSLKDTAWHSQIHRARFKRRELAAKLLLSLQPPMKDSLFLFENNIKAAHSNWSILWERNFSTTLFEEHSALEPTFEFNNLRYLGFIFKEHPSWLKLEQMLRVGIQYLLSPIEENIRKDHLEFNLNQGNHPAYD